jgi:hypothetical protein
VSSGLLCVVVIAAGSDDDPDFADVVVVVDDCLGVRCVGIVHYVLAICLLSLILLTTFTS